MPYNYKLKILIYLTLLIALVANLPLVYAMTPPLHYEDAELKSHTGQLSNYVTNQFSNPYSEPVVKPIYNKKTFKVESYRIGGKLKGEEAPEAEMPANDPSEVVGVPLQSSPAVDIPLNEPSEKVEVPTKPSLATPVGNGPIENEVSLPESTSSIFEQGSLIESFGINSKENYYKKSEKFYIRSPSYKDVIDLIGVGFIEAPNGRDCGQRAAYLEWYLERHGVNASIIVDTDFLGGHAWVMASLPNNETIYIDASKYADLDGSHKFIRRDNEYVYSYSDKSMHRFSNINQALLFKGNKEGDIDLTLDWWNTGWGKRIIGKT